MDDAGPGAIRAISAWRNMACEAAEGSLSEEHDNWVTEVLGADPRACAGVVADFGKGLASGVAKGVTSLAKGVAKGAEAVASEGYALAPDSKARAAASHSLVRGADAAGTFVAGVVKDPGTAMSDAAGAAEGAACAVAGAAEGEYAAYETAAASGRGAAFLGEAVGEGALLVGGALIPSGGEAEAGIIAAEGTEAVASAAELTEGLPFVRDNATNVGEAGKATSTGRSGLERSWPGPPNELPPAIAQHWEAASKPAQDVLATAARAEPLLRASIQGATKSLGGDMKGLEFCKKTAESLTRKIATDMADSGVTADEAAADIADAVRYTATFPADSVADGATATLGRLQQEGHTIVKLKNTWLDPRPCYKGINVQMRSPEGQLYELQFHTPESYYAKETGTHGILEQMRRLDPMSQEWARLNAEQERIFAGLKAPDNIHRIRPVNRGL